MDDIKKTYHCNLCPEVLYTENGFDEHLQSHDNTQKMYCDICLLYFPNEAELTNHYSVHKSVFYCDVCSKHFFSQDSFDEHNAFHTDTKPLVCHTCHQAFNTKYKRGKHRCPQKEHVCGVCTECFDSKENLEIHLKLRNHKIKTVKKETLICKNCNKQFLSKSGHDVHRHTCLGKKGNFICNICQETFQHKITLGYHVRKYHGASSSACDKSNKATPRGVDFNDVSSASTVSFPCDLCNSVFSSKISLSLHKTKVHVKQKLLVCGDCKRGFYGFYDLEKHREAAACMYSAGNHKEHVCDVCSECFDSRQNLEIHFELQNHKIKKSRTRTDNKC